MRHAVCLLLPAIVAAGCTSYANDFIQPMKFETRSADGTLVTGAECQLANDKTSMKVKSGDTIGVRRSREPLTITCRHPQHPDAQGQALSRINPGMLGNVVFGSGISGLFERSSGSAYAYPAWVRLEFGRNLTFDRDDQPSVNEPTPGKTPPPAAPGKTS